jgi:hypothetical protein
VVQAEELVNDELLAYARNKNIPILSYTEKLAEAYDDFYDQLYPTEE